MWFRNTERSCTPANYIKEFQVSDQASKSEAQGKTIICKTKWLLPSEQIHLVCRHEESQNTKGCVELQNGPKKAALAVVLSLKSIPIRSRKIQLMWLGKKSSMFRTAVKTGLTTCIYWYMLMRGIEVTMFVCLLRHSARCPRNISTQQKTPTTYNFTSTHASFSPRLANYK